MSFNPAEALVDHERIKVIAIVTTISPPSLKWLHRIHNVVDHLIVVGDNKTPKDEWLNIEDFLGVDITKLSELGSLTYDKFILYMDPKNYRNMEFWDRADIHNAGKHSLRYLLTETPENDSIVRNFGFLAAQTMWKGAEDKYAPEVVFLSIDDDNWPIRPFDDLETTPQTHSIHPYLLEGSGAGFADPLRFAILNDQGKDPNDGNIPHWFRGIPHEMIRGNATFFSREFSSPFTANSDIRVLQYLNDGDPDVDAIVRITNHESDLYYEYKTKEAFNFTGIKGSNPFVTPFNSQSTFFNLEALKAYCLVPGVGRACDIYGAYLLQHYNRADITYVTGGFKQERNLHNHYRDLEKEITAYEMLENLFDASQDMYPALVKATEYYRHYANVSRAFWPSRR